MKSARLFILAAFSLAAASCSGITQEQWLNAGTQVASAAASGAAAGFTSGLASNANNPRGPFTATK